MPYKQFLDQGDDNEESDGDGELLRNYYADIRGYFGSEWEWGK